MTEATLLGGVSVETLCAVLAASIFVADCVIDDASQTVAALAAAKPRDPRGAQDGADCRSAGDCGGPSACGRAAQPGASAGRACGG